MSGGLPPEKDARSAEARIEETAPGVSRFEATASDDGRVFQAGRDQFIAGRDFHLRYPDGVHETLRVLPGADTGDCPYPGLPAFESHQAGWFFGRDRLTADLVEHLDARLREGGALAVVGVSGAGKSSLLHAGLLPALDRNALPGAAHWPRVILRPTADPLGTLVARLSEALTSARLAGSATGLPGWEAAVREELRAGGPGRRLVLVVDQVEELFTACESEADRHTFLDLLTALAQADSQGGGPTALVVFGLRADFYGTCTRYPQLREVLRRGQVLVGPLAEPELRQAILFPARTARLDVQPGLVELLLSDLGVTVAHTLDEPYEAGRLPLLAHALRQTWIHRHGHVLTVDAYRLTGGIHRAVATTAEQIHDLLAPAAQAEARTLFLHLVRLGDGVQDTRRRLPYSRIATLGDSPAAMEEAVERFVDGRLLTRRQDSVEITHEALLSAWPRLRRWIDTDRAGLLVRQNLGEAAYAWTQDNRDPSALYRGTRLEVAREWADDGAHRTELPQTEREFLDASVRLQESERAVEALRIRRRKRTMAILAVFLVIALIAGAVAWQQYRIANGRLEEAQSRQMAAVAAANADVWPRQSQLLAAAAWRRARTTEARNALLDTQQQPLYTVLHGHHGAVQSVAFSPDGHLLASGDVEGTVRLWDPDTGAAVGRPIRLHKAVNDLDFSKDGKTLALASTSEELVLVDVESGRTIRRIPHDGPVVNVAFSPSGKMIATTDGTPRLWDTKTGAEIGHPFFGHKDIVTAVAFGADDRTLITSGADGTIRSWDTSDQSETRVIDMGAPCIFLAYAPVTDEVACPADVDAIARWDMSTGKRVGSALTGHTNTVWGLAYGRDGEILASASDDQTVRLWDARNGQQIGTPLRGSIATTFTLAFSPDASRLAVAGANGDVLLYRPILPVAGDSRDIAISHDGRLVAFGEDNGTVQVRDRTTGDRVGDDFRCDTKDTTLLKFRSDGGQLAAECNGKLIIRKTGGAVVARYDLHVVGLAYSPDGGTLAAATYMNDGEEVILLDLASGKQTGTRLWHSKDTYTMPWSLNFSPDGTRLAVGYMDGKVRVWDTATRTQIGHALTGHTDAVQAVAFAPDSGLLATCSWDNTVRLWDTKTGKPVGPPLIGHSDRAVWLSFNDDGSLLASAGWDGAPRVWDVAAHREQSTLSTPGEVEAVQFTADNSLLGISTNGSIVTWQLAPNTVLAAFCARIGRDLTRKEWTQFVPAIPYQAQCSNDG